MNSITAFAHNLPGSSVWLQMFVSMTLKGTLILCTAFFATFLLRKQSAVIRHSIWSLAIVSIVLVPLFSQILPSWNIPILKENIVVPESAVLSVEMPLIESSGTERSNWIVPGKSIETLNEIRVENKSFFTRIKSSVRSYLSYLASPMSLLLLWAAGFVFCAVRLGTAMANTHRMVKQAQPVENPAFLKTAKRCSAKLRLNRDVAIIESKETTIPMAWGLIRSSIVLPVRAKTWDVQRLELVLFHELSHIKRRDFASNLFAQIVSCVNWFNPFVWYALRQQFLEREKACDEMVLSLGVKPTEYAQNLLEIARMVSSGKWLSPVEVALARTSNLEERIMKIVNTNPKTAVKKSSRLLTVSAGLLYIVSLACFAPVASKSKESEEVVSSETIVDLENNEISHPEEINITEKYFKPESEITDEKISKLPSLKFKISSPVHIAGIEITSETLNQLLNLEYNSSHPVNIEDNKLSIAESIANLKMNQLEPVVFSDPVKSELIPVYDFEPAKVVLEQTQKLKPFLISPVIPPKSIEIEPLVQIALPPLNEYPPQVKITVKLKIKADGTVTINEEIVPLSDLKSIVKLKQKDTEKVTVLVDVDTNVELNALTEVLKTIRELIESGDITLQVVTDKFPPLPPPPPFSELLETINSIVIDIEKIGSDSTAIYVDFENGSDVTGDGTKEMPYESIEHAIDAADLGDKPMIISRMDSRYLLTIKDLKYYEIIEHKEELARALEVERAIRTEAAIEQALRRVENWWEKQEIVMEKVSVLMKLQEEKQLQQTDQQLETLSEVQMKLNIKRIREQFKEMEQKVGQFRRTLTEKQNEQLSKQILPYLFMYNEEAKLKLENKFGKELQEILKTGPIMNFDLPKKGEVVVEIHGNKNNLIRSYPPESYDKGFTYFFWDGKNNEEITVDTGMYLMTIKGIDFEQSKIMEWKEKK